MSKGYRNGAFALGLVVGCGLALNLFLWLDYITKQEGNQPSSRNNEANSSEIGGYWDWAIGTFISPSDTLAQWIMAAFTVAVVFLVWKTLIATQNMAAQTTIMASDTRGIGESQIRAYLHCASISVNTDAPEYTTSIEVHNFGQTPAKNAIIWCHTWVSSYPLKDTLPDAPQSEIMTFSCTDMPPGFSYHFRQPHGCALNDFSIREIEAKRAAFYVYGKSTYKDVFGNDRWSRFLYFYQGDLSSWDGKVMPYRKGNQST